MNRVKLYRIYAIANQLEMDITFMSGNKSDKLKEIKDLCDEINNEQQFKY